MAEPQMEQVIRSLQHLPEAVRAQLVGAREDGQGGLVSEVLTDVLRNLKRAARTPFEQPERWQGLQRAMSRALGLALRQWSPNEAAPEELEKLRAWMQERAVSQQFLLLLLPKEDSKLDVASLSEEMEASGLGPEPLGQSDGEAWLRQFVAGFYHGVAAEPHLHELIPLPLLRQLAESMGAQVVSPGEGDGMAGQLEYIEQLVHRLRMGEDVQATLLAEIQKTLAAAASGSHVQRQAVYQTAENALSRVELASGQERERKGTDGAEQELLANIQHELGALRQKLDVRSAGPGESELAEMESLYRKTLRGMFERLTFKGITQTGRAVSLPLEEVYVELKVLAEVPEVVDGHSVDERRLLQEMDQRGALDDEQGRELDNLRYRRWRDEARREQARTQRRSLDASGVGLDTPAMVILGDPGSGKTTLLHYLALRAMRTGQAETVNWRLPIFVPLAAYDEYLRRTDSTVALEQFLSVYYAQWRNLRGLGPLFQRALEQGRALVLLDGLDEVLELATRQFVAQQVSSLIERWVGRGNRFVMASRFIGYREVQLSGDLPHFMVLDFQPPEIKQFAHKWCEAFEVWAAGGKCSDVALRRAQQEEQALLADVNSKPSVEHLASNPLLLTMLALLRRQVGQLPARRIELYDLYVRMLLERRELSRSEGARQRAPERLETNVALQHLMDLALWLQQNRPSGMARQRDIVKAMAEMALRREDKPPERAALREWEDAERKATRCLQEVRDIAGLIGERGHDAYGFLHLTFQEYLVGRALAREQPENRWQLLRPNLHDPRWHEPILLCAGQLGVIEGREDVTADLVSRIMTAQSEHEAVLHRDLFLAVAVIADDVTRSGRLLGDLTARLESLCQASVPSVQSQAFEGMAHLMRLGHESAKERLLSWLDESLHLPGILHALAVVLRGELGVKFREKLLVYLAHEDWRVRHEAVEALRVLTASDSEVRQALLARLDDPDSDVQQAVVEALGAVAASDMEMRQALLARLDDPDSDVQQAVVEALGAVAASDVEVRQALLARLDDPDSDVRQAVVEALGVMAASDVEVRQELLARLGDPDSDVRQAVVEALGVVAASDSAVRQAFLARLDDPDSDVQQAVVEALGAVAASDVEVRQELLARLDDPDSDVRHAMVRAVGTMAGSDSAVREALLARLHHQDSNVRHAVVEALGTVAGNDSAIREALLARLHDQDWPVRQAAVGALSAMAGSDSAVREALLARLHDQEKAVRQTAVEALSAVAGSDLAVREALLARLHDQDWPMGQATAASLGIVAGSDLAVREALLPHLHDHAWQVRQVVVRALGAVASSDLTVREALLTQLNDQAWQVGQAVAGILGSVAGSDSAVREVLLTRLHDNAWQVRHVVVGALGMVVGSDSAVREALLAQLHDNAWQVRQIAIRALGKVANSDSAVREALLSGLDDQDSNVRRAVVGALGTVASSDSALRAALLARMHDQDSDVRRAVVGALGTVASSDPAVREALMTRLDDQDSNVRRAVVGALSTVASNDSAVRDVLLTLLDDQNWSVRQAAAGALGKIASSDSAVREALMARLDDQDSDVRRAVVGALGTVASSDPAVREALMARLDDQDWPVRRAAVGALGTMVRSDSAVCEALMARLHDKEWQVRQALVRALGAVADSNSAAREALLAHLHNQERQVRQAAVEALGAVASGDSAVREMLLARLHDQEWLVRATTVRVLTNSDAGSEAQELFLPWLGTISNLERSRLAEETRQSVAMCIALKASHDKYLMTHLFRMLQHPDWQARRGAVMVLMLMLGVSKFYIASERADLLANSRDREVWPESLTTTEILLNMRDRKTSEKAIDFAMRTLDYGTEPWYDGAYSGPIRSRAAEILGQLEPTYRNERVLQRLLRLMQEDREEQVRDSAYHAVLRLITAPVERPQISTTAVMRESMNERFGSILHLSDLHFESLEQANLWYGQLAQDLRGNLHCDRLDGLVLSGDITNKSIQDGYEAARSFLEQLCENFKLEYRQVVVVPGNHDLCRATSEAAYHLRKLKPGDKKPSEGTFIDCDNGIIEVRIEEDYKRRFERFAKFYEQVKGEAYPLDYDEQALIYHFPELGLIFLGLNSAWHLDHHYMTRAEIRSTAVLRTLERLHKDTAKYNNHIKVAVWHHPISGDGEDRIKDHGFLELLADAGFRLGLHGHIHKAENSLYRYAGPKRLEIVAAGTFGAPVREWRSGYPLQYNLLRFRGHQLTVKTRRREQLNGAWKPDGRWGESQTDPFYTVDLS